MNLPTKLTIFRIYLSIVIIIILLFPFDAMGIDIPRLFINETLVINLKYIIAGVLFLIASITDFFDGYLARKRNEVTEYGKMLDAIADKVLMDSMLIILSAAGFVKPIITVVIVVRDIAVDLFKMTSASHGTVLSGLRSGKIKTACLMTAIGLTLFYNLPFELWNLKVSDFLLIVSAVLSVISGAQFYQLTKKVIGNKK